MTVSQPLRRIKNAEREVARFRDDVILEENWMRQHAELADKCRLLEDLVAKANFLFERIMDLDTEIQESSLSRQCEETTGFQRQVRDLVADWRNTCLQMTPYLDRLAAEYGGIEGAAKLRENLSEARGILTDDREFFAGDELVHARDKAIDDFRAGLAEPMSHGEGRE